MWVLSPQIQSGTSPNQRTEDITVLRTHEAGTLRADHISQTVTLTG
jgi:hypothetical protein